MGGCSAAADTHEWYTYERSGVVRMGDEPDTAGTVLGLCQPEIPDAQAASRSRGLRGEFEEKELLTWDPARVECYLRRKGAVSKTKWWMIVDDRVEHDMRRSRKSRSSATARTIV
jgi:hypothetical protein